MTRAFDFGGRGPNDLHPPAWVERPVKFSVFDAPQTLPVLVSRGCAWGRCTFCSEANGVAGQTSMSDFAWLAQLHDAHPSAAFYFQDSIFPFTPSARERLLPMLRAMKVEWGCQVYLPMLSREKLRLLAAHGCRYVYTGLESASAEILAAVGKPTLTADVATERLGWTRDVGLRVGVSLMFGSMAPDGALLETKATVEKTLGLASRLLESGVKVAGFYPNVETVLPGTALAMSLARAGRNLDFYSIPRCEVFDALEDGGVGYNFLTLPGATNRAHREHVGEFIRAASAAVADAAVSRRGQERAADTVEHSF